MTHHRAGLARILSGEESPDPALGDFEPVDRDTIESFCDALVAHARDPSVRHPLLSQRELAMLGYALKLTATPARMVREDLEPLRAAGLDDGEILDVNQVAAYFAYVNRLVDGLGVELEFFHR